MLPLDTGAGVVAFELRLWSSSGERWIVARHGDLAEGRPLVRIESACAFGHLFASEQCDCGFQWRSALASVGAARSGVLLYGVDQDARGLGLEAHFEIYRLRQQENLDSEEIYRLLDRPMDVRSYEAIPFLLRQLGITRLRLLSNNRARIGLLEDAGFDVETEALTAPLTVHNMSTLMLEHEDLNYTLDLRTDGDWLETIQPEVVGWPDRRRLLVVDSEERIVHRSADEGGWELGRIPALDGTDLCVAYLTDLPRVDEVAALATAGVAIIVVPVKDIPAWLRHIAAQIGIRVVYWARRNAYAEDRAQWALVGWRTHHHLYERGDERRVVGADGRWRAIDSRSETRDGTWSTDLDTLVVNAPAGSSGD